MNENQTASVRPTKKQRELLAYIEQFIGEHGYSPSYREVMRGLEYTSVATVALHVGNLIKRGHLRKRDHSARSLEVVRPTESATVTTNQIKPAEEKWLIEKIEHAFTQAEQGLHEVNPGDLKTLIDALRVLGLEGAAHSFAPRFAAITQFTQVEQESAVV